MLGITERIQNALDKQEREQQEREIRFQKQEIERKKEANAIKQLRENFLVQSVSIIDGVGAEGMLKDTNENLLKGSGVLERREGVFQHAHEWWEEWGGLDNDGRTLRHITHYQPISYVTLSWLSGQENRLSETKISIAVGLGNSGLEWRVWKNRSVAIKKGRGHKLKPINEQKAPCIKCCDQSLRREWFEIEKEIDTSSLKETIEKAVAKEFVSEPYLLDNIVQFS